MPDLCLFISRGRGWDGSGRLVGRSVARLRRPEHLRARDGGDSAGMDAAVARIGRVVDFLRANQRPDLIVPLAMEWVTQGRDVHEHARWRGVVDALVVL